MENKHISVPEQKNYDQALQLAYRIVSDRISKIADVADQCRKSGSEFRENDGEKSVVVSYLNQPHKIDLADITVSSLKNGEEVGGRDRLLILHYFASAKGTPLSEKPTTFQELPEGVVYSPTFAQRTINPLTRFFGPEPDKLLDASKDLGGRKADFGDIGIVIPAFVYVPITIVFWRGDDELPPQGNILFDSTITDYLATEDITVLCEIITWRLVRNIR